MNGGPGLQLALNKWGPHRRGGRGTSAGWNGFGGLAGAPTGLVLDGHVGGRADPAHAPRKPLSRVVCLPPPPVPG